MLGSSFGGDMWGDEKMQPQLRWCLFFANKANRVNEPHGLRMRTHFFFVISEQSKQKSKQTEQAKKLVRMRHVIKTSNRKCYDRCRKK